MDTLSPDRLIIVILFLAALFAVRFVVTRHKDTLSHKISGDRRLKLCEALPISGGGRVMLFEADGQSFCIVSHGKSAPAVVPLSSKPEEAA